MRFDAGAFKEAATPAQGKLAFDVVSVKAGNPNQYGRFDYRLLDRVAGSNIPVTTLIRTAFETRRTKIVGLPAWSESAVFDVVAESDRPTSIPEKREMIRSLLETRFGLAHHYE